jgi:hypothetical protein
VVVKSLEFFDILELVGQLATIHPDRNYETIEFLTSLCDMNETLLAVVMGHDSLFVALTKRVDGTPDVDILMRFLLGSV